MNQVQQVMILGGAGTWGHLVSSRLAQKGIRIITVDNLSTGDQSRIQYGPLVKCNIEQFQRIGTAIQEYPVSTLIHCALRYPEDNYKDFDLHQFYSQHLFGLLKLAQQTNLKKIILTSPWRKADEWAPTIIKDCQKVTHTMIEYHQVGSSILDNNFLNSLN